MSGVEKDWTTKAGLRAIVYVSTMGHRCGYVAVPSEHVLHGRNYSDLPEVDVHGGVTWSDNDDQDYPTAGAGLWWFGFDCAHLGDLVPSMGAAFSTGGILRSLEFCERECESLAAQLVEIALELQS